MRACSSPPARLRSNSAALSGCPVSRRTPASLTAAHAVTKPSSRSRARSTLSCAVVMAVARPPVATAATGRVKRVPARARAPPRSPAPPIAPARRLERAVEEFGSLVQLAAYVPGPAQYLVQDKEELPLPCRACESQGTGGVRVGFGAAVEVELRGSEPGRRVEAARELAIGEA